MSTINEPQAVAANLKFQSAQSFDTPLRESEHFLCVATLGSIIPGWVLITPKRQVLNFSQLNGVEREDLSDFLLNVSNAVERRFGEACVFEHGAVATDSLTGCGVDQAHLHVVPKPLGAIRAMTRDQRWNDCAGKLPFELDCGETEYLWFGATKHSFIAHPERPVSQYFRRAVAMIQGVPHCWNYNVHPFHEHIRETQNALLRGNGVSRLCAA